MTEMQKLFVQWARSKGYQRPLDPDALRVMHAQFLLEFKTRANRQAEAIRRLQQQQAQTVSTDAAGDATHARDPISSRDPAAHLVRNDGGLIDIADPEHEDSDFGDLIRDKQRAMDEAGGDELAAHVIHREGARGELIQQAPFVRINPPSVVGKILGQTIQVTNNGIPLEAARWDGDAEDATAVTITAENLNPFPPQNVQAGDLSPYGVALWGTRAAQFRMEFDFGRGTQFTVNGSSVALQLAMENTITGASTGLATGVAASIPLTGTLSFQPCTHAPTLTRTLYPPSIGAGQSTAFLTIPRFAKTLRVYRFGGANNAITIIFTNTNTNTGYSFNQAAAATITEVPQTPIQLAGSWELVQITNNGSGTIFNPVLVFELGI